MAGVFSLDLVTAYMNVWGTGTCVDRLQERIQVLSNCPGPRGGGDKDLSGRNVSVLAYLET